MENNKIKLLILPSDTAGVGHFRSIWPAQQIQNDFSDEFFVEINATPDYNNVSYFKQFDIIHFHRQMGPYETMPAFFKELKDAGVTLIMDIDDYWSPSPSHPLYMAAMKEKIAEKVIKTFKLVDYVTTTTEIFAGHIKLYNKNVIVMPNALDMKHKMWADEDTKKTDKVRISWIGGSSHMKDLEILKSSMKLLHNDVSLRGKYQIVMCGYDVRGSITEIHPDGNQTTRKITPEETIWNKFEEVFTDNYNPNIISEDYKNYLKKCDIRPYQGADVYESNYVRRWTLPLTQYGKHYNYCDICLSPLSHHTFNEVKSELKIIEAGMKNKVLIAQDYSIYKKFIKNGENGLLINNPMNEKGWYVAIKNLIENPELREKLANNLHEFVSKTYNLKTVTEDRISIYRTILEKKQASIAEKEAEKVTV